MAFRPDIGEGWNVVFVYLVLDKPKHLKKPNIHSRCQHVVVNGEGASVETGGAKRRTRLINTTTSNSLLKYHFYSY